MPKVNYDINNNNKNKDQYSKRSQEKMGIESFQRDCETRLKRQEIDTNVLCEKHVRIDEELPLVYNPKSFSLPDLLCVDYEKPIHKHPILQLSVSASSTGEIDVRKYLSKQSFSPFNRRKIQVKNCVSEPIHDSSKWFKAELSRPRGKSYPPHNQAHKSSPKQRTHKKKDKKFVHLLSKINIFSKHKKQSPERSLSSFYDLPPIRACKSAAHLPKDLVSYDKCDVRQEDEETRLFSATKSYSPKLNNAKIELDEGTKEKVTLVRIQSLPIL